jgi:integrase
VKALRQALNGATAWRLIDTNPARAVRNPRPKRAEVVPFTPGQVDALAAELGPVYAPLVVFAAETGLRPSEWIALERRDVQRGAGVVLVERTFAAGRLRDYGKTAGSRRRVPLSSRARAAVDALPARVDTRLLFPAPSGRHLDLHRWRQRDWHPALDAAGIDRCGPYRLRHTFATNALAAGIGIFELARYMGTSVEMIDETYGHLAQGSEDVARAKLDRLAEGLGHNRARSDEGQ